MLLEIIKSAAELLQLLDLTNMPVPRAGAGGGIDVVESVNVVQIISFTLIFVSSIGAVFGLGLAFAAKRFSVKLDPRIEHVKGVLASAHCGACGYPGCQQYAEAVVGDPDVSPSLCSPGGARTSEAVAGLTGKIAEQTEPIFSRIMCTGGSGNSTKSFIYEGVPDCRAAILAGGGDKSCRYGCLGYGTCVRACPFDALSMGEDALPVVDITKCTGCRKCEVACPKNVIEVLPAKNYVLVTCHSKDKGGTTKKYCTTGCIGCKKCVKVCPFDAPHVESSLSTIDLQKCRMCGLCVPVCPTNSILDFLPVRPKAFILDNCNGCHKCAKICHVDAASGERKQKHTIDQDRCTGCGICTAACPLQAIDGSFNFEEVKLAAAEKKAKREAEKTAATQAAAG